MSRNTNYSLFFYGPYNDVYPPTLSLATPLILASSLACLLSRRNYVTNSLFGCDSTYAFIFHNPVFVHVNVHVSTRVHVAHTFSTQLLRPQQMLRYNATPTHSTTTSTLPREVHKRQEIMNVALLQSQNMRFVFVFKL